MALHIESEQDKLVFSLIAVIMVFAINIFTYYIYDKAKETAEKKMREEILIQQCEYYIRQNNESTEWWQELKRFRHDMKQHYILEKTYLDAGNYEALREFCNENLSFISGSNIVSDTGNIYFDSIINFKADVAKIQGIKVVADVRVPKDVRINPEHLSICLGNILDNAIEASEELREDKIIYVYVCVNGKNLFINVKNRYQNARHKIDDKYITSKRNKNQHGFGLEIIKQIVDQYEGELKIIDKNNEFEVEIILYDFVS